MEICVLQDLKKDLFGPASARFYRIGVAGNN